MDSIQESLTCPVCFEEFEENGKHVPRLLPCSHTLCHKCIGQLIRDTRLECPTCRVNHEAKQEETSFPQNKYILTLRRRLGEFRKCPDHEENMILFCGEAGCQRTICPFCLSETHLGHKAVAIQKATNDVLAKLLKNIELTNRKLNAKLKKVENASKDIMKKTDTSLELLERDKEEMIQRFEKKKEEFIRNLEEEKEEMTKQYDGMIEKASEQKTELKEVSRDELASIKENISLLQNIKQSVEEEEVNTYDDVLRKLDTVRAVTENVDQHLPRKKSYQYSEYVPGRDQRVGTLLPKETSVFELQGEFFVMVPTFLWSIHKFNLVVIAILFFWVNINHNRKNSW